LYSFSRDYRARRAVTHIGLRRKVLPDAAAALSSESGAKNARAGSSTDPTRAAL